MSIPQSEPCVHFVAGLPASGKTSHLKTIENQYEYYKPDWHGWNQEGPQKELVERLSEGKNCLIESSRFTNDCHLSNAKNLVKSLTSTMQLTLFRNDPLQCIRNALNDTKRSAKTPAGSIGRIVDILEFTKYYRPYLYEKQDEGIIMPVWGSSLKASYVAGRNREIDRVIEAVERRMQQSDGRMGNSTFYSDLPEEEYRRLERDLSNIVGS